MAVGCQDGQGHLLAGRGKGRRLCVEAGDERGLGEGESNVELSARASDAGHDDGCLASVRERPLLLPSEHEALGEGGGGP
jgi:hypothetical protein